MIKGKTEAINCPLCSCDSYRYYDSLDGWQIVACNECDLKYTNPRPTIDSLPEYYSESYFQDERHVGKFYEKDGTLKKKDTSPYINRIQDVENFVTQRGSLLEVGAARGGFLNVLKDRGWKVKGLDISQDAVDFGKKEYGLDMFCGHFTDMPVDEKYDVICMYQTLEHLPDPGAVIAKSASLLNPWGLFIAEIPNLNAFDMKINKERRRLSYDLPRHLNHFSVKVLSKHLRSNGFEVINIDRYYPNFILELLNRKNRNAEKHVSVSARKSINKESENKPLMKYASGWKNQLLRMNSRWFPGWRFTITAMRNG